MLSDDLFQTLRGVCACPLVPTLVPWYFWGESLVVGCFVPGLLRHVAVLNATWLVNSVAHMWGNRPYDKNINPRENKFVSFSAIGKVFFYNSLKLLFAVRSLTVWTVSQFLNLTSIYHNSRFKKTEVQTFSLNSMG